ncbi:acyltransferase family protein [Paractinoplanes atraurantiacus]|uniref:Peptidoglycan/LPS O-acetylase OafA/YrhL, contains acyltransferase and SGNH-hydrolase domains n=1 Tax=Paractinoplanes atraurantiacus TaxID=1036182 RepID=A0A285HAD1_9ACTN|nr:acyltransferase [Actinoplanes atraurantiacus]SNY32690.1 Peptidoglycan/LPS O-acetylase OafA/YrhL, contains acyltransferase and SGNH-hydrolase domains [Actinoplanes atraurantiacus]
MSEILSAPVGAAPASAPVSAPKGQRMAWLDALRGFAAATVALFHLSPFVLGRERHLQIYSYFDFGKYGVLLFFLVSGYVIPMSLERHGSLRKFWIGRLFRIYPTYLFAIVTVGLFMALGFMPLNKTMGAETITAVLGQVTMLQDFVGIGGLITPFWTLSFEMAFYLIVAGLFVWGLHRLSAWWAAGLAVLAIVAGTRLPDGLLGAAFAHRRALAALLVLVLAASLYAYFQGRRVLVLAAGAAGIGLVLLPMVNGHATKTVVATSSWQAVLMLSVMFAGTVIYRLQHGQTGRRAAIAALSTVFVCCVLTNWLHTGQRTELVRWTLVSIAVAGSFGLAFALRGKPMPAVLTWLGAISFSVYLTHIAVMNVVLHITPDEVIDSAFGWIVVGSAFIAGTLALSSFAYRFVEQPGQKLGRRAQKRVDAVFGMEEPLRAAPWTQQPEPTPVPGTWLSSAAARLRRSGPTGQSAPALRSPAAQSAPDLRSSAGPSAPDRRGQLYGARHGQQQPDGDGHDWQGRRAHPAEDRYQDAGGPFGHRHSADFGLPGR